MKTLIEELDLPATPAEGTTEYIRNLPTPSPEGSQEELPVTDPSHPLHQYYQGQPSIETLSRGQPGNQGSDIGQRELCATNLFAMEDNTDQRLSDSVVPPSENLLSRSG